MGGSPPTIINPPAQKTTVMQSKNPLEAYQALADLTNRYKTEGEAAQTRLDAQTGTAQDIGQRMLDRDVYTAAMQRSSLPSEASQELKDVTSGLLAKAKQKAAAGPAPSTQEPQGPLNYSWVYGQTQKEIDEESKKNA